MPNFFDFKKRTKRTGTTNFKQKESPVTSNVQSVVDKATDNIKRTIATDDKIDEATDKPKETNSESQKTANESVPPETSNTEHKKTTAPIVDETMTDVMYSFFKSPEQYTMTQVTYTGHSEYVPNAHPMFTILDEALRLMGTSQHLSKYYANLNPYAVKVGFAYCWYFQIIEAKLNAGLFSGREPSLMSRFKKAFPLESIPIPDILYPYFRTLVGTRFSDAKYDWIIPSYGSSTTELPCTYTVTANRYVFNTNNGLEYSCPNIPAMMMILSSFGAETQQSLGPKMHDGVYRPFGTAAAAAPNRATTGFHFADNSFNFGDAATDITEHGPYSIFRTCGTASPFQFWSEDAQHARRHMANSGFYGRGKPAVFAHVHANANIPTANYPAISDIEAFLFLGKEYNPAFFGYILEQMIIFCKFWPAKHNLAQVPKTGGLFTTINAHLRYRTEVRNAGAPVANQDSFMHADRHCGLEHPNQVNWYPKIFDGLSANFTTSRGGITRFDELIAFTFGTNSIMPIQSIQAGNNIRNFKSGKYFEEESTSTERFRLGDNQDDTTHGYKDMYEGWTSEVLSKHFIARPN